LCDIGNADLAQTDEDLEVKSQNLKPANPVMGLILAFGFILFWLAVFFFNLFLHDLGSAPLWQTIGLIALLNWLYVGVFIIAHDTMHGSLWPDHARFNAIIGTGIMFFYAGFNWRFMREAHHAHHDFPGTDKDPDFNAENPTAFWPWYFKFFTTYFGLRQILTLAGFTLLFIALGAPYFNTIIMWAVPAILSSLQLFYFGTYLTHKHGETFPDEHNARTNNYPAWLSLLTCFHFGYHHEHHIFPHEPWWRLPLRKRQTRQLESAS